MGFSLFFPYHFPSVLLFLFSFSLSICPPTAPVIIGIEPLLPFFTVLPLLSATTLPSLSATSLPSLTPVFMYSAISSCDILHFFFLIFMKKYIFYKLYF